MKCTTNQTCTIDYVSASAGLGPWSAGISINARSGEIFFSPINISPKGGSDVIMGLAGSASSGLSKPMQIMANTANIATKMTPLGFLSDWGGASIMFGRLQNVNGVDRTKATSSFLNGEAYSCSSAPLKRIPIAAGMTVSGADFNEDPTTVLNKVYAIEAGVAFNGSIIDCNRSNSYQVK